VETTHAQKVGRRTQAERLALTDNRMFDAAVALIVAQGPQRATLSEIGTLAGYSRGLAAYHYGTKDVFYSVLINYLHELWCAELDKAIEHTTGEQTIVAAVTALQNFVRSSPNHLRAMFKLYYYSIDHESDTTRKLQEIHSSQRRQAMRWFAECPGFDGNQAAAEDFAEQYSALVFGAIYQWLVNPDRIDLGALLERCKVSLQLLLPRPPAHP
jgi:AcrR family transcriptional regulator